MIYRSIAANSSNAIDLSAFSSVKRTKNNCRYGSDVAFTARAWPRSHAGLDPMPENMNLDYLKLRYREFEKYEVMTMSVVGSKQKILSCVKQYDVEHTFLISDYYYY